MVKRLLVLTLVAACSPRPAPEAPSAANAPDRHREVHWVRTASEYRALTLQAYRMAGERVRVAARGRVPGTWAVVLDADETVLDNSAFEARIAESGVPFQEEMWDEWVLEEAAGLVPGAGDFIALVEEAGGRVAIVTNRHQGLCSATRRNLAELGVEPAALLCETEASEKEPRFRRVRDGTAVDSLPPLEIVAWVGDNIGDFPGLDQAIRYGDEGAYWWFGERYFVLPNPMYGSWMGNEWR